MPPRASHPIFFLILVFLLLLALGTSFIIPASSNKVAARSSTRARSSSSLNQLYASSPLPAGSSVFLLGVGFTQFVTAKSLVDAGLRPVLMSDVAKAQVRPEGEARR